MTTHEEKAREIVQSLCFENAHFWCAECGCVEKVAAALLQAEQRGIERAACSDGDYVFEWGGFLSLICLNVIGAFVCTSRSQAMLTAFIALAPAAIAAIATNPPEPIA